MNFFNLIASSTGSTQPANIVFNFNLQRNQLSNPTTEALSLPNPAKTCE